MNRTLALHLAVLLAIAFAAPSPGRGALALRAIDIPGSQVMDVRYVVLTLLRQTR